MSLKVFALAAAVLAAAATAQAEGTATVSALPAVETAEPDGLAVMPPDAIVEGESFGQWTAKWWQWAFAQAVWPYLDPDGRLCTEGQEGPVWFLAGTNGRFTAQRECVVPAGKYLLVPIINMLYMNPHAGNSARKTRSCAELQADAAVNNDHLLSAVALVDGVPVTDVVKYRIRSEGCFPLTADGSEDKARNAAADGYWLLLKPLTPGRHTISIGANYGSADTPHGHMLQNFEYVLHVGGSTTLAMKGVGWSGLTAIGGKPSSRRPSDQRGLERTR